MLSDLGVREMRVLSAPRKCTRFQDLGSVWWNM
ncbi:MAG: hypothetical protein R3E08_02530 [Thiotrichaceae bacterium]